MRVLIFQAATSALAIAAMTKFSDEVRAQGHAVGLRQLQHFRNEKEPADRIIVALTPQEAAIYKNLGVGLVQTFADTDRIIPVELPDQEDEDFEQKLQDFDFSDAIAELDDNTTGFMSLDKLKAEAIERGLEVRADSTREELEHALDLDQHPGRQAADRVTDRQTMDNGYQPDRIGFRTSAVLPTANGIDLDRLNDDQLAGVAAALGIEAKKGEKRAKLVNKITSTYAAKVDAPAEGFPKSAAADPSKNPPATEGKLAKTPGEGEDNADLNDLDEKGLQAIAEKEEVDLGRSTSVDGMKAKIVEARAEKAKANG